jgi:hypothetical protein
MFTIHAFHRDGLCEMSNKQGEVLEVSSEDGTLRHALLSIRELTKLLRFRDLQEQKNKTRRVEPAKS